jgi:hypothetical protein
VKAWPCSQTPHVIAGDFVGGLNKKMFEELISLTIMPSARNSVLAFNLLAGREGTGREIFVEWKAQRLDKPAITDRPHRGLMVWSEMGSACYAAVRGVLEIRDGRLIGRKDVTEAELAEHEACFEADKHRLVGFCRPESHQYVSESGQRFDSIVAIHPLRGANLPHWRDFDEILRVGARKAYPQALRGSISAVMAHRTMRLH